jgi:hypothetical protein
MTAKPNIGLINALIRIAIGLTLLAWTTAKLVKKPWRDSYLVVAFLAAMKVAEGIVRYCPMTELFKIWEKNNQQEKAETDESEILPYNPT